MPTTTRAVGRLLSVGAILHISGNAGSGMKLKEPAEAVEVSYYASVGTAIKLLEKRSGSDSSLARLMIKAKTLLNNEM